MSIHPTEQGTYRVRWRNAEGRERSKTFKRKRDAEKFERETLVDLQRGYHVDPGRAKLTVREMADVWLTGARNLGQGGRDTYERDLKRYVLPALGDLQLKDLTPDAIDAFLTSELVDKGLAASTVHRHYRTVRRLCQVAVERGRMVRNPCDTVHPPRIEAAEMHFLTAGQVEELAGKIGARYRAWVLVAGWGGLRWSELVGLRRSAVQGARLTIAEQLIRRDDRQWHRDKPKTRAGRRVVTLPASVASELARHMESYTGPDKDDLVFPNAGGRPMNGPSFRGNVFKPALIRAGLPENVRPHDLRHTAVALAIAAGAHPKAIQARMGHASITVTLDRYGHLFPEMDENLANGLDALRRAKECRAT